MIVSLGGGAAIVAGFASWLGKVWASRLMAIERAAHEARLAELRASLEASNQKRLAEIQRDMTISQEKQLGVHRDKLDAYRRVVDVIVPLLAAFTQFAGNVIGLEDLRRAVKDFEEQRLRLYGYLALVLDQA